ncbi:acyltransferase [bacterium]|nr:acyltransferase [bacterium]
MNSFYNKEELKNLGLKSFGKQVLISKKCSIYSPEKIEIGDNVRIDDFCILSGKIKIGTNVHISAYSALYAGDYGINIKDYAGISSRCTLYAQTDDYSGNYMVGACLPDNVRNIIGGEIILDKYSIIGSSSVILPNTVVSEGVAIGAMSFLEKNTTTEPWYIYVGSPLRKLKKRNKNILNLVKEL